MVLARGSEWQPRPQSGFRFRTSQLSSDQQRHLATWPPSPLHLCAAGGVACHRYHQLPTRLSIDYRLPARAVMAFRQWRVKLCSDRCRTVPLLPALCSSTEPPKVLLAVLLKHYMVSRDVAPGVVSCQPPKADCSLVCLSRSLCPRLTRKCTALVFVPPEADRSFVAPNLPVHALLTQAPERT